MGRLTIHDVEHGSCITLVHDNGNVMMWDCGASNAFSPTFFLTSIGIRSIQRLFITNFDQDHITDLNNLVQHIAIETLYKNPTITADELRQLKLQSGPLTNSMSTAVGMLQTYNGPLPASPPDFGHVYFRIFYNPFGPQYPDTNNISLVTILELPGATFLIPGDVEESGWNGLLAQHGFAIRVPSIDYVIAPHHGRTTGYSEALMNLCSPKAVIMSDGPVVHATQEDTNLWAKHCQGTQFKGNPRSVLTTRNDGEIFYEY